jgi:hypothetical protein
MIRTHCMALLVLGTTLLVGCGDGRTPISLGDQVTGQITSADSYWKSCDSSNYCNEGYSDRYEITVTAGKTYSVSFSQASAGLQFEDLEHGRLTDTSGTSSTSSLSPIDSPLTWVPAKGGVNRVGIYTSTEYLPASYSFVITSR